MKKKILISLFIIVVLGLFWVRGTDAQSCEYHNVWGWAWSDNIGWVSFSCKDIATETINYGVNVDESTGLFSGYAWSDNIGWISFNRPETGPPPSDDACSDGSCIAKIDLSSCPGGICPVLGWARALSVIPGVKYEHFELAKPIDSFPFAGDHWEYQVFTVGAAGPNESHTADYISLWLARAREPGIVIVDVYDVLHDYLGYSYPDMNSLLCSGSIDGNKLPLPGQARWIDIPLGSGCDFSAGTEYAFVVKVPNGSNDTGPGFDYILWYFPTEDDYPGGHGGYSNDFGSTWQPLGGDKFFQVWKGKPMMASFSGGWDGWVRLSDSSYGVSLNSVPTPSEFEGWAWGSDVIGWISFNCLDTGACGVSDYKVMTDITINIPSATNLSREQTSGCGSAPIVRFSWDYNDDDNVPPGTDPQSAYEIQIDDDPNLDEDPITTLSGGTANSRDYSPPSFGTTYWWRVRVRDTNGPAWSGWADGPNFTPTKWPDPDFIWCPLEPDINETIQFCSVFEAGVCDQAAEPPCSNMTGSADNLTTCEAGCSLWKWDFGDGGPSNLRNPTHSYSSQGPHGVQLIVTDVNGKSCPDGDWVTTNIPFPVWKEIPPF